MGAPNPETRQTVRAARQQQRTMGDPLDTDSRMVQRMGGSLYINPTGYAEKTLNLELGDEVQVETYADRVVIKPPEKTDE